MAIFRCCRLWCVFLRILKQQNGKDLDTRKTENSTTKWSRSDNNPPPPPQTAQKPRPGMNASIYQNSVYTLHECAGVWADFFDKAARFVGLCGLVAGIDAEGVNVAP